LNRSLNSSDPRSGPQTRHRHDTDTDTDTDTDNGNTATFSALREAYRLADQQIASNPGALTSTDGETNRGIKFGEFSALYRKLFHRPPRRCRRSR
jgi:hypothetical protein